MKKSLVILFLIIGSSLFAQQNIGMGTLTPNTNAALEIQATDKGLLIPRLATSDRTALGTGMSNTENSMLVYDINDSIFYYWKKDRWVILGTDDQNLDSLILNGTNLTAYIEDGTSAMIDLTPIIDSTHKYNEWIDSDSLGGGFSVDFIYAKQAMANGESVVVTDNGSLGIGTTNPTLSFQINKTDAAGLPTGTTAQRPATPPVGATRFNTDLGALEVFNGTCWQNTNTPPIGATYVQWSAAADPNTIYPCTVWISTDVQNGEFMRATGGNSNVAAGGTLTGTIQTDAIQQHDHSATLTVNNSGTLNTSIAGTHNHGGETGGVQSYNTAMWIPYDDNLSNSSTNKINDPVTTCGNPFNENGTIGNFMGKMNSSCLSHTHVINDDGNHLHTVAPHNHTGTVTVTNATSANTATETRPSNVAVKFWRRIN